MKKFLFRITTLILVFLFAAFLGELYMRIVLKNELNANGIGPATAEFNSRYVQLNSKGQRDCEHEYENKEKKIRIVGIGDSYHFGAGIKNINDLYFMKLASELNEKFDSSFEIINISKGGWNIAKYYQMLTTEGIKYSPDFVILGIVFNDIETPDMYSQFTPLKLFFISDRVEWFLRNNSYLYYSIESRITRIYDTYFRKTDYVGLLVSQYNDNSPVFKGFIEYFDKISEFCKSRNIKLITVLLPCIAQRDEDMKIMNKCVLQIKNKVENKTDIIFDANTIFLGCDYRKYSVSEYDMHPNEAANKEIADSLYPAVLPVFERAAVRRKSVQIP